jgi:hypothetical protein
LRAFLSIQARQSGRANLTLWSCWANLTLRTLIPLWTLRTFVSLWAWREFNRVDLNLQIVHLILQVIDWVSANTVPLCLNSCCQQQCGQDGKRPRKDSHGYSSCCFLFIIAIQADFAPTTRYRPE